MIFYSFYNDYFKCYYILINKDFYVLYDYDRSYTNNERLDCFRFSDDYIKINLTRVY